MQRERLHLGVLLEGRARPRGDIRVAGAVNHGVRLDVHEAVLVGDQHRADASAVALHAADEGVEQHRQPLLLLADEAVEQQLELEGIADGRVVLAVWVASGLHTPDLDNNSSAMPRTTMRLSLMSAMPSK